MQTEITKYLSAVALSGFITTVSAGTTGPINAIDSSFHYIGRITGAADFVSTSNHTQTLTLLPDLPGSSTYISQSSTKTEGLIGGFLGFDKRFSYFDRSWEWQLGVSYYKQLENYNDKGVLNQTLGVATQVYNYNFSVGSQQVFAEGRLLTSLYDRFLPYIMLGLGASFNSTSNYQTRALDPTSGNSPIFTNHTSSNFAVTTGLGLDFAVTDHCRLGLGYRYAYLGNATLGVSPVQTSNARLNTGTLYNNQVALELSILI